MEEALRRLDVPIIGRLPEGAFMDGGDKVWFDARTLFVGRSHRTNDDAIGALRAMLGPRGVDVHAFDLPNYRGPDTVLHLMSVLSPVDHDLAVVYEPLAPVALLDALRKRGIDWLTLDDEEFATQGSNVLALAPRRALLVAGNDRIAAALRGRGAEVHTFSGEHLAIRGDGGPTCLTQPIHREK